MNQVPATTETQKPGLIAIMAAQYDLEPRIFQDTVKKTCMTIRTKNGVLEPTTEEFAAFLMVAREHGLNPLTREIYAFPKKGGGIQPVVSIDGWMKLINDHPNFDGMEFEDEFNDAKDLVAITCKMFRKDRAHPVSATEYMEECKRPTEPWQKWPKRMLRHKAAIQAARYAFSFSGIIDPDEAERSPEAITSRVEAPESGAIKIVDAEVVEEGSAEDLLSVAEQRFEECTDLEELELTFLRFDEEFHEMLSDDDWGTVEGLKDQRMAELETSDGQED